MERKSKVAYRFFVAGLATLFACAPILTENAYAARKHRPPVRNRYVHHYYHRPHVSPLLPLTFALVTIAGMHYYHHRGVYYRETPYKRYVVTKPPVGAVVTQLPPGYVTFRHRKIEYYYYGDAYYNRVPSGYTVVKPPYKVSAADSINRHKPASPLTGQVKVATHLLNVRSGPGMNHPIIFQIPNGAVMETHGTAPEWLFVKLPSGEFGWVMQKFTVSEPVLAPASRPVPAEG